MVDNLSKEKRSKVMSSVIQKDTKPELILRKALWKDGLRYRVHYGKPKIDIAFVPNKVAIFVDGCFWHMCPEHSHFPDTNKAYWVPKLKKNALRDKANTKRLSEDGWKVLRFWEHEVLNEPSVCIRRIEKKLG